MKAFIHTAKDRVAFCPLLVKITGRINMARINVDKFICDVCKVEYDLYPPPGSLVVRASDNTENVIPDICIPCQQKVSDFINSMKA